MEPKPELLLNPKSTSLLLLDYQVMVVGTIDPDVAGRVVTRAASTAARFREAGATVAHVRLAFTEEDFGRIPATNNAFTAVRGNPAFLDGRATTEHHDQLAPLDGDLSVRKTRVGGFSSTSLEEDLRRRGIDTLVLGGLHTSRVVLATSLHAADRDFRVFVAEDLCADPDDDLHKVLITKVLPRSTTVTESSELTFT